MYPTKSSITFLSILCLSVLFTISHAVGQIDISYSPYTITKPGSYIFVSDIVTTKANISGIQVTVPFVEIDLNGHSLTGPGKTVGSSGSGIRGDSGIGNVTIRNGTIKDFRNGGIYFSGNHITVKNMKVISNGGIGITANDSCRIEECTIAENSTIGIELRNVCLVEKCDIQRNGTFGITALTHSNIINCQSISNKSTGINLGAFSLAERNDASDNGGSGISSSSCSRIISNQVSSNMVDGIIAGDRNKISLNATHWNKRHGIYAGSDNQINDNVATNNTKDGIWANFGSSIANNLSKNNSNNGISANIRCTINDNQVSYNKYSGISTDNACQIIKNTLDDPINVGSYSTVKGNTLTSSGIKVSSSCMITDNLITLNSYVNSSTAAIFVSGTGNRIDKNHLTDNYCGIYFTNSTNWFGSNSFTNNDHNTNGSVPSNPTDYPNIYF